MAMREGYLQYRVTLVFLMLCLLLLIVRLIYFVLSDPHYFPITKVKISATYAHITRKELEHILVPYVSKGFFGMALSDLTKDLQRLAWTDHVHVQRVWPDTLNIVLTERVPTMTWNGQLMTAQGVVFQSEEAMQTHDPLPQLMGPASQKEEVLQNYEKLSKLVSYYGLNAMGLTLRPNQDWELLLRNGIWLRLGKKEIEARVTRFCRAYAALEQSDQWMSADLRYARGMAVQWKPQTGK